MVWGQAHESIGESACQLSQEGRMNLFLWRKQDVFTLVIFRAHVFSPAVHHKHLSPSRQQKKNQRKCQTGHKKKEARCAARCLDSVPVFLHTYLLFSPLLPLVLCVLQHLLSPKVKEIGWVGVELQTLLPIIPADVEKKPVKSWWVLVNTFMELKRKSSHLVVYKTLISNKPLGQIRARLVDLLISG